MPQLLTVQTDSYNGKEYVELPLTLNSDFSIAYGESEYQANFIVEKDTLLAPFEIKYYKNGFLYTLDTNIKPVQNRELEYWYFPRKITANQSTQLLLYFGQAQTEYIIPDGNNAVPFVAYFDNETEWLVEHNFNTPISNLSIEIKDENGTQMWGGGIEEINHNSFRITHDNVLNLGISGSVKVKIK